MLVIQLRRGESVAVGEAVIKCHKIEGNTVKLAINAPLSIAIVRAEAKNKEPKERNGGANENRNT